MTSIRYIVQKYSGVLKCESTEESFSIRLVLFETSDVSSPRRRKRGSVRALTAVPLGLVAAIISLNCMPATVSALEDVPVLGAAVSAVDFATGDLAGGTASWMSPTRRRAMKRSIRQSRTISTRAWTSL